MGEGKRVNFVIKNLNVKCKEKPEAIYLDLNRIISAIAEQYGFTFDPTCEAFLLLMKDVKNTITNKFVRIKLGTNIYTIKTVASVSKTNQPASDLSSLPRQKLNYENITPDRWPEEQFIRYFNDMHHKTYGIESVEALTTSKSLRSPKGRIKILIAKFEELGYGRTSVRDYIKWVFEYKAQRMSSMSFALLMSDAIIQEWRNKGVRRGRQNDRKLGEKFL